VHLLEEFEKKKKNTGTCNGQEVDTQCERAKGRQGKKKKKKDHPVPFVLPAIKICSGFNVFRRDIYPTRQMTQSIARINAIYRGLLICHNLEFMKSLFLAMETPFFFLWGAVGGHK
jgi:hypothetical protein